MRPKYVEEAFKRWFVFGRQIGEPWRVDLSDSEGDVFEGISEDTAKELIEARDAFVDRLTVIFMKDPDALYKRTKWLKE